jgi:hypothetical protein
MTMRPELAAMLAEYRAGLDAEMKLLRRLEAIAIQQREASRGGDLERLSTVSDQRDTAMASLVTLEHQLRPIRQQIAQHQAELAGNTTYEEVAARHRDAKAKVEEIVSWDRESIEALKKAEIARSFAARTLEKGESTLAAYRRVVAPTMVAPTLVNKKG